VVSVVKQQEQSSPRSQLEGFHALRQKLIYYFEARRLNDAADLADEVIMRAVEKLEGGLEVSDITRYSYGIAKYVLHEYLRKQKQTVSFSGLSDKEMDAVTSVRDERPNPGTRLEEEELRRIRESSIHEALLELRDDERKLLLDYYCHGKQGSARVAARKAMAARLGITDHVLTLKIFHLRRRVKESVEEKISSKGGGDWHG